MILGFILAALSGAALLGGGFYFGLRMGQGEEEVPEKRKRRPKCYVIDPKDFGEEERSG